LWGFLVVSDAALALSHRLGRDARDRGLWRARIFHAWGRTMARLLGMRVEVLGRPPESPFVLVANHLGYVDVILLASRLGRCVFVSKAEVRDWFAVGRLCASVDTLFIQRESKREIPRVVESIEAVLAGGRGVVLFPEGTSSGGDAVLRFRPALLEAAARAELPVHCAAIAYRTPPGAPPASEVVCWWRDMPFVPHVWNLLALPRFEARLCFAEETVCEPDRKLLAERLQRMVERQLRTVV
jgi:lyso-ornithine lipid O-acyltransferase